MLIRRSSFEDNEGLLKLTKACPMEGLIKLRIDRNPDYFSLLELKGEYLLFVAEENNQIIGAVAFIEKIAYINRIPQLTGYISDLKILPEYRSTLVAIRLVRQIDELIKSKGINYTFILSAKGNKAVNNLFKGRAGITGTIKAADFYIFQFLPKKKPPKSRLEIIPYEEKYENEILEFLNKYNREFQFGNHLEGKKKKVDGDQAWIVIENSKAVAFLSVVDMEPYKQNVVLNIPLAIKIPLSLISIFLPFFKVPKVNQSIKMMYVQHLAFATNHQTDAIELIKQARLYTYQKEKTFLSIGMDKRNILFKKLKSLAASHFESEGFVVASQGADSLDFKMPFHDNFHLV